MSAPPRFVVELRPPRKGERYVSGGSVVEVKTAGAVIADRWVIVDLAEYERRIARVLEAERGANVLGDTPVSPPAARLGPSESTNTAKEP